MIGTFVTVGNARQPFPRLLEAAAAVADALPGLVLVQRGHTAFQASGMEVVDFLPMERFARLVAEADVLIMHAGAGSVIQAVRAGRVPIVMARRAALGEHVNDHQVEFVRALEATGKVRAVEDAANLRRALALAARAQGPAPGEPPMVDLVRRILRERAALGT